MFKHSNKIWKKNLFKSNFFNLKKKNHYCSLLDKIDFNNLKTENIRNFCITSHIDHGIKLKKKKKEEIFLFL